MLKETPRRSAYSATTGGELHLLAGAFMPEIRLVMEDGTPAEVYYRIQSDGEGVLVLKQTDVPQRADPETNSGSFDTGPNAASPDLLSALENLVGVFLRVHPRAVNDALLHAQVLIAKVKGE